jgi:pectinesterase
MTAQGRESYYGAGGLIIHYCTITATPDLIAPKYQVKTYLGQPWKDYPRTVKMESLLDNLVDAQSWME